MPAPAQLTRSSIVPRRSASAMARAAVSEREASPATCRNAAAAGALRDTPTTVIRSFSSSAMAKPSPVDAPVTIATPFIAAVYDSAMPLVVPPAVPFRLLVLIGGGEFSFGDTREIDE